jgi:hypothetical protein
MNSFGFNTSSNKDYNKNKDHEVNNSPLDSVSNLAWTGNFLISSAWDCTGINK